MEIRLLREGEEDRLILLLNQIFGNWYDRGYWDWLYENNPSGKPAVGVAVDNDQIIASYTVCPVPIMLGKDSPSVGLGIDAATHPQYRRRGLFSKVATTAFKEAESRGFHYILGYSEWGKPAALGQVTKLYFKRVFAIKRLVKILSWSNALAFKAHLPMHPPSVDKVRHRIERTLEEHGDLNLAILARNDLIPEISTIDSRGSIFVNKSPEYIQWRYFDNPEKHYLLFASNSSTGSPAFSALDLRREKRITVGVIVDIFGNPQEWKPLLKGIESLLRPSNVPLLEAYLSEGHRAIPMLTSMGYKDRAYSLAGILRPTINATSDEEQVTSRAEAWQTTLADDPSL